MTTKDGLMKDSDWQPVLSDAQLREVEEYAGLCFTPEQIAIIMDLSDEDIQKQFRNRNSPFFRAYKRGELMYMAKVRKSIFDLARGGSSASQTEFLKLRRATDNEISKKR